MASSFGLGRLGHGLGGGLGDGTDRGLRKVLSTYLHNFSSTNRLSAVCEKV